MALNNCKEIGGCGDDCPVYDLCEVTIKGGNCTPSGETSIICEGFKLTSKIDSEIKTNSACYEGYGYQLSNLQYEWEITNPCDRDWFDKRFIAQLCDKYSMEITGYVQKDCGDWVAKETLTACIIEETGREYGKGLTRTLKGKALHRILHDTKEDALGNVANASKGYLENLSNSINGYWKHTQYSYTSSNSSVGGIGEGSGGGGGGALSSKEEMDWLKTTLLRAGTGIAYGGIPGSVASAGAGLGNYLSNQLLNGSGGGGAF